MPRPFPCRPSRRLSFLPTALVLALACGGIAESNRRAPAQLRERERPREAVRPRKPPQLSVLAGRRADSSWRFFEGSAEGDDLMPFVWLAICGDTVYGSVAHRQRDIGFRLKGKLQKKTVRLEAIYPLDGRRIGRFSGRLRRGRFQGEWTAVGRVGRWSADPVLVDPDAVESLAGAYFDPSPPEGIAGIRVELDGQASLARVLIDRDTGQVSAEGPWTADAAGRLWFMALSGDRTLGGLIPFDISVLKVPAAIPYRLRTTRLGIGRLRLFNPVKPRQPVGALDREAPPVRRRQEGSTVRRPFSHRPGRRHPVPISVTPPPSCTGLARFTLHSRGALNKAPPYPTRRCGCTSGAARAVCQGGEPLECSPPRRLSYWTAARVSNPTPGEAMAQ
jgi:hypothetical protein